VGLFGIRGAHFGNHWYTVYARPVQNCSGLMFSALQTIQRQTSTDTPRQLIFKITELVRKKWLVNWNKLSSAYLRWAKTHKPIAQIPRNSVEKGQSAQ